MKTTFWYKKVALHIMNISVFNSYALHEKFSGNHNANVLELKEAIGKCPIKDKMDFDFSTTQ